VRKQESKKARKQESKKPRKQEKDRDNTMLLLLHNNNQTKTDRPRDRQTER
jgi:hypothetical protein